MLRLISSTALVALLLSTGLEAHAEKPTPDGPAVVTTDNETPVLYDDDEGGNASGDDPAIWVAPSRQRREHRRDRDRQGRRPAGLRPRRRASSSPCRRRRRHRPTRVDGRYNNVDIAYGLRVGGERADVAVVSDRYNDTLRFFVVDPSGARRRDAADRGDRT